MTRLRALAPCQAQTTACVAPPDRVLSLSHIFFDLGDQAELDAIYADQLPASARYDYTIAAKQQEILAPNLPLLFNLASVDGFDGGVLPLLSYSETVAGMLPPGATTTDGRLRELLPAAPAARWLDLFNARYLITDKVGDQWRQGVFFDLQHPATVTPDAPVAVDYLPDFAATEIWLLAGSDAGVVDVTLADGRQWAAQPRPLADGLWRVAWADASPVAALTLQAAGDAPWTVAAVTLVNAADETFQSVTPGPFRLIYSGDVKIYEKLDALPRAFVVGDWQWQPDAAAAVVAMQAPDFDPRRQAVLVGTPPPHFPAPTADAFGGTAIITAYAPERVVIQTDADAPALLILSDAAYPGWTATVDGAPAPSTPPTACSVPSCSPLASTKSPSTSVPPATSLAAGSAFSPGWSGYYLLDGQQELSNNMKKFHVHKCRLLNLPVGTSWPTLCFIQTNSTFLYQVIP